MFHDVLEWLRYVSASSIRHVLNGINASLLMRLWSLVRSWVGLGITSVGFTKLTHNARSKPIEVSIKIQNSCLECEFWHRKGEVVIWVDLMQLKSWVAEWSAATCLIVIANSRCLSKGYAEDPWNVFDAMVVIGSIVDIVLSEADVSKLSPWPHLLLPIPPLSQLEVTCSSVL